MFISLSPTAKAFLKAKAETEKAKSLSTLVESILETIFRENSCYVVLCPTPAPEKLNALQFFINTIMNGEFYGFRMLTKEEYEEAVRLKAEFDKTPQDEPAERPKLQLVADVEK